MGSGLARTAKFLSVAVALGFIAVVPGRTQIINPNQPVGPASEEVGPKGAPKGPKGPAERVTDGPPVDVETGLQCFQSKNGGKTATGVTAAKILLASTVVQSGPGSSFLADSPTGMQAILNATNQAGGVCGRLLSLTLTDDGWDAERGLRAIKSFVSDGMFALPVVPSSEGLTAAIEARVIDNAGIPVVGTDGMLRKQYMSPWVWPVATATESTMRIMARYGYEEKKTRCFGIVYDTQYKFGKEGAEAFRRYVKTLPGAKVCADVGIFPARASYSSEIQRFNSQCNDRCDFVAMLLEPQTALTWIAGRPDFGTKVTSGAQTLFNEQFAASCGKPCAGMLVWTGYNPPIGNLAGLPDVAQYVKDVRAINPKIDVTNQFLEGAYLGMKIFVEALRKVGPNLTRQRLRDVLNSTCFKTDLSSKLCWTENERHANKGAQAFSVVVAQGSFAGFRNEQTGFIKDPG